MTRLQGYGAGASPEQVRQIVQQAVGASEGRINQRLDSMDQRLDSMDRRLENIDQRLDSIGHRLDDLVNAFAKEKA